jgi:FkbM family methyltransferase
VVARLTSALKRRSAIRHTVQAFRVARSLDESIPFLLDAVRGAPPRRYTSKRTCRPVTLRARHDLQVAREFVSKRGYEPPAEIRLQPRRILDLGANIGLFTLIALERYGPAALLTAVEPDPENMRLLEQNVRDNDVGGRVTTIQAAAGTAAGTARLAAGLHELSHLDERGNVEVPVVDFFDLAVGHDLVKMDIEGGEWPILRDRRLPELAADVLVMEWHTRGCEAPDPAAEAERLLATAGYRVRHLSPPGLSVGELWAWRPPRTLSPFLTSILDRHVALFNEGVRSGDFAPMLEQFADDAELVFVGVPVGPFAGKAAIAEAYREQPPDDEIDVRAVREEAGEVVADYAWRAEPEVRAGELRLTADGDRIRRLVVTFG